MKITDKELAEELQKSKYKPCSKEHSKHDNDCKDCVAVNGYKYKEKKMGMKLMSEDAKYLTIYLDKKEEKPTLEECQKFVGGYIEIVQSLDRKKQIIVDEEGLLKSKPINKDASKEAGIPIVGDVMILSGRARLN